MRPFLLYLPALLLVAVVLGSVLAPAVAGAPSAADCAANLKAVLAAVQLYVQDHDDTMPSMTSAGNFEKSVLPYAKVRSHFLCPITGKPYQPNYTLSGKARSSLKNPGAVEVAWDAARHPDGTRCIGYADGHVAITGAKPAAAAGPGACVARLTKLKAAADKYAGAHGGKLPPMPSAKAVQAALGTYAKDPKLTVCPITGQAYSFNPTLGGKVARQVKNPGAVRAAWDAKPHPDRTRCVLSAAGKVTVEKVK